MYGIPYYGVLYLQTRCHNNCSQKLWVFIPIEFSYNLRHLTFIT